MNEYTEGIFMTSENQTCKIKADEWILLLLMFAFAGEYVAEETLKNFAKFLSEQREEKAHEDS